MERKNRTTQEMGRVLLNAKSLPQKFSAEIVHTACHIINRVYLRLGTNKTAYEIWKGKKPNFMYFHIFGSRYFILKDRHPIAKFKPKSIKGIFLGHSSNSRAYRVFNKIPKAFMGFANIMVDDQPDDIVEIPRSGPSPDSSTSNP